MILCAADQLSLLKKMDRLFISANLYYATLERFGPTFWLKARWAWLLAIASGSLLWGVWRYLSEFTAARAPFDWMILYIVIPELIFIIALDKVRDIKTSAALSRINQKYKKNFTSLDHARRFLLSRYFGRDESKYLSFAEEIGKAMILHDQIRIPIPTRFGDAARLIYDPDSKQRIYALLIVIASALTALAIREDASISNLFELFNSGTTPIIQIWLMITFTLAAFLSALLFFRVGLIALISYLLVLIYGKAARDPMTLRHLQRDLLKFNRFIQLHAEITRD